MRQGAAIPPSSIIDPSPGDRDRLYAVSELAREFGITARAIRFYENKKLLAPGRVGPNRAYTNRDRARLVLILRGKRLGFSLREIAVFLSLYDGTGAGAQIAVLSHALAERIRDLEHRRAVLDATLDDLRRLARTIDEDGAAPRRRRHDGPDRDAA